MSTKNEMTYPVVAALVLNTMKASDFEIQEGFSVSFCDNWERFCEMMSYEGFTKLGSGYFSAAFKHEAHKGKVFKFGFKKEDSGAAYAAWCRAEWDAGRGCSSIPKIEYIERNSGFYMVVMPEYRPLSKVHPDVYHTDVFGDSYVVGEACSFIYIMEQVMHGTYETYSEYLERMDEDIYDDCCMMSLYDAMCSSELFLVLKRIGKHFQGVATFDLHSENFMFDGAGNLVITDPVSFTHEE